MLREHEIEIRVRYQETDGQRRLHHANFLNYFEIGRIELMRASGVCYKELEDRGVLLVVAEVSCRYFLPVEYDDTLRLRTLTRRTKGARIFMDYQLYRDQDLVACGASVIASVNRRGKVQPLPHSLLLDLG